MNIFEYKYTICRNCGKIFFGHFITDGLCIDCYLRKKFQISEKVYNELISKEFKNMNLFEKFSFLSDLEEKYKEDRDGIEKIKKVLSTYIRKIIELKKKISSIELEANLILENMRWCK
ncbi:MAG: hypothetical protein ACTSQG_09135 [Promethearchaeota archaeon]